MVFRLKHLHDWSGTSFCIYSPKCNTHEFLQRILCSKKNKCSSHKVIFLKSQEKRVKYPSFYSVIDPPSQSSSSCPLSPLLLKGFSPTNHPHLIPTSSHLFLTYRFKKWLKCWVSVFCHTPNCWLKSNRN